MKNYHPCQGSLLHLKATCFKYCMSVFIKAFAITLLSIAVQLYFLTYIDRDHNILPFLSIALIVAAACLSLSTIVLNRYSHT